MSSDSDSDPCLDVSKHMNKCMRNFHENYKKLQSQKQESEGETVDSLLEVKDDSLLSAASKTGKQQDEIEGNISSGSKNCSESVKENETNNVLTSIMDIFKAKGVAEDILSSDEDFESTVATRTRSRKTRKKQIVNQNPVVIDDPIVIEDPAIVEVRKNMDINERIENLLQECDDFKNDILNIKKKRKRKVKPKPQPVVTVELSDEEIIDPNPLVQVKVEWRSLHEKTFEVKKLDTLQTIFDYYVNTYKVKPSLLFFSVNNKEINLKNNSFATLRLTEDSVIEGGSLPENYLEESRTEEKLTGLKFKVQYDRNKSFEVYIKPDDMMDILYAQVIKETSLPLDKFKLLFDGEIVKHSDDIEGLGIEEGEVFDVFLL